MGAASTKVFISVNYRSDKLMTVAEAAYVAGIVDGEGTISMLKVKRPESPVGYRHEAYLSIPSTAFILPKTIREMTGNGRIHFEKRHGPWKQKDVYTIRFSPNQIRHVLPQIRPYLVVKREQADIVLEFLGTVKQTNQALSESQLVHREGLRQRVKALNQRGRDAMQPLPENLM